MVKLLKTCCCGCTLKKGTQIIAWLSVINAAIFLLTAKIGALEMREKYTNKKDNTSPFADENGSYLYTWIILGVLAYFLIAGVFQAIFSCVLLTGVKKEIKMVMYFTSCCCGCSLKAGSVTAAVISLIFFLGALGTAIIAASDGTGALDKEVIHQLNTHYARSFTEEQYYAMKRLSTTNAEISTADTVTSFLVAIVSTLHIIFDIMLIFGASTERPRLVRPWIGFALLSLIFYSIILLGNTMIVFSQDRVMMGFLKLFAVCVFSTFGAYFILVVNSFHKELISNNEQNKI